MAPSTRARPIGRANFSQIFSKLKTSTYTDNPRPSASVSSSHYIRTLSWNDAGTLIATGAHDRTLRIWNPDRPNVRNSTELKGLGGGVERVQFHPINENELASCTSDGLVKLWDVRTKASVGELKIAGSPFTLAWRPDGSELLVGTKDNTLVPISRETWTPIAEHKQEIQTNQCVFDWSGKYLYVTNGDGRFKILRYPSFETINGFTGHTSSCSAISLSPSGEYLAVGGGDSLVSQWDTTNWICIRTLDLLDGPVRSVDFSFDGSYITAGADDCKKLKIVHVVSGELVHTIEMSQPASQVAWHPFRYILAYSADKEGLKIVGAAN
ncbi:WD40 repeat-like protein [Sporormia fimetaria CBS 119925]|uniref:WD40 repeat-like protein n=1 Tax=Sporormia fimetaria CBS 119925 TaxID=1340428 RepID=A0A6A6VAG1_9PLEO|nr:WD40 repeat-like protein [Sporormia fimetaria CBS 119925]